jgi:hypothetical protein
MFWAARTERRKDAGRRRFAAAAHQAPDRHSTAWTFRRVGTRSQSSARFRDAVALRDVSPWTFVAWSRGLGLVPSSRWCSSGPPARRVDARPRARRRPSRQPHDRRLRPPDGRDQPHERHERRVHHGGLRTGDLVVLAGAAAFAGHIVAVDVLVERYAAVPLALPQMAASAALTAAIAVPTGPQAGGSGGSSSSRASSARESRSRCR